MRTSGIIGAVLIGVCVVGCGGAAKSEAMSPHAEGAARYDTVATIAPAAPAPAGVVARSLPAAAEATAPPPAQPADAPTAVAPAAPRRSQLPEAGQLTAGVWDDNINFDFWKPYASRFRTTNGQDFAMFGDPEISAARAAANGPHAPHAELDIQLVLDTTGSMGDELAYLQSEFDGIAAKIRGQFPNVTPRWSLVVYRDHGDDYLTRAFDFTTDTNRFRRDLRAQSAAGGGDTPEAVVEGLGAGLRQSWRSRADVAKVAFWVADAPAHPGEGQKLANVIRSAQNKGVHVYPIAASDTDDAAEYQMRSAAQLTGGRYLFLTNDSGIGNDHAEPHIPCYNVTRLDNAIVRMIAIELSGRHVEPERDEVVRAVGRPDQAGKCQLPSGALVASY